MRMAMSSRCTGAHRVRPATVAQAVVAPAGAFGHYPLRLDGSGDLPRPLHGLDGRVVLGRRIGIGPEPDEERAGDDQGRPVDDEDRLVGVIAVERDPAQGRTDPGADTE